MTENLDQIIDAFSEKMKAETQEEQQADNITTFVEFFFKNKKILEPEQCCKILGCLTKQMKREQNSANMQELVVQSNFVTGSLEDNDIDKDLYTDALVTMIEATEKSQGRYTFEVYNSSATMLMIANNKNYNISKTDWARIGQATFKALSPSKIALLGEVRLLDEFKNNMDKREDNGKGIFEFMPNIKEEICEKIVAYREEKFDIVDLDSDKIQKHLYSNEIQTNLFKFLQVLI